MIVWAVGLLLSGGLFGYGLCLWVHDAEIQHARSDDR